MKNEQLHVPAKGMSVPANMGIAYTNIAFDEPNLFQYLYMSGDSGCFAYGLDMFVITDESAVMIGQIAAQLKISEEAVSHLFKA